MVKRLVDIDDGLLERAQEVLETRTMKDTVNAALESVVNAELRRAHADRLRAMDGLDLDDDDVMKGAWR